MKLKTVAGLLLLTFLVSSFQSSRAEDKKKIVLIAGRPSHGPGEHEHNAGVLLLKKCLEQVPGIGPKRRKALLKAFDNSIDAIKNASIEELMMVKGITQEVAVAIKETV